MTGLAVAMRAGRLPPPLSEHHDRSTLRFILSGAPLRVLFGLVQKFGKGKVRLRNVKVESEVGVSNDFVVGDRA